MGDVSVCCWVADDDLRFRKRTWSGKPGPALGGYPAPNFRFPLMQS